MGCVTRPIDAVGSLNCQSHRRPRKSAFQTGPQPDQGHAITHPLPLVANFRWCIPRKVAEAHRMAPNFRWHQPHLPPARLLIPQLTQQIGVGRSVETRVDDPRVANRTSAETTTRPEKGQSPEKGGLAAKPALPSVCLPRAKSGYGHPSGPGQPGAGGVCAAG